MRPQRTLSVLALVAGLSMALTACGDDPAPQEPGALDLSGKTFIGDIATVADEPYPLVKGSMLRLSFEDGQIGASAGCNSMSGTAQWTDNTLIVDDGSLAMTEMGCDEPLMAQDTWFADFLTASPTLIQDSGTLTMTSGKTAIVLTDEEIAVPDASLTDTAWNLDSIVTGDTAASVPAGVSAGVEFTGDGRLLAQLGCNSGRGSYTATEDELSIDPLASTKMACDPPASEVEAAMLSVLQGEVQFTVDGVMLTLTPTSAPGSGPSTLVFRALN